MPCSATSESGLPVRADRTMSGRDSAPARPRIFAQKRNHDAVPERREGLGDPDESPTRKLGALPVTAEAVPPRPAAGRPADSGRASAPEKSVSRSGPGAPGSSGCVGLVLAGQPRQLDIGDVRRSRSSRVGQVLVIFDQDTPRQRVGTRPHARAGAAAAPRRGWATRGSRSRPRTAMRARTGCPLATRARSRRDRRRGGGRRRRTWPPEASSGCRSVRTRFQQRFGSRLHLPRSGSRRSQSVGWPEHSVLRASARRSAFKPPGDCGRRQTIRGQIHAQAARNGVGQSRVGATTSVLIKITLRGCRGKGSSARRAARYRAVSGKVTRDGSGAGCCASASMSSASSRATAAKPCGCAD